MELQVIFMDFINIFKIIGDVFQICDICTDTFNIFIFFSDIFLDQLDKGNFSCFWVFFELKRID